MLLADAMSALLDRFRPSWLDEEPQRQADPTAGQALDLALYESPWEAGRMVFTATGSGIRWTGSANMLDLDAAIDSARIAGLDGDVEIAGESVPVKVIEDSLEVPIGPFLVVGTPEEWRAVFDRERAAARPLSAAPERTDAPWTEERTRFPVSNTD
jgi:hypothetical protein